MAEQIISKQCSKCKEVKLLSEFYKNRSQPDGCQSYCNTCKIEYQKQYRKSEKGKIARKKYRQSKKGKATVKIACERWSKTEKGKTTRKRINQRFHQTKKYKIACKRYAQSKKGKIARIRATQNYNTRHPERIKARLAVKKAIKDGLLPPINTQQCVCSSPAKNYHHNKGYNPENWLNVIPVCQKCHILRLRKVPPSGQCYNSDTPSATSRKTFLL